MPEPDCFLRYRISAGTRNFTPGKSDVYVLVAAATCGFTMVLFSEPSKHLCRRYMRCTECPSSFGMFSQHPSIWRKKTLLLTLWNIHYVKILSAHVTLRTLCIGHVMLAASLDLQCYSLLVESNVLCPRCWCTVPGQGVRGLQNIIYLRH